MAIQIKFDTSHSPELPTFVLAKKNGDKIGKLDNITGVNLSDCMNSTPEISFTVHKYNNGKMYYYWDYIRDFRLVWCKEFDTWFEMFISLEKSTETTKYVTLVRLGEAELSQINLYDIEINTETDIDRDDYSPTVLYDPENTKASLLHRIIQKAPHYSIRHVDDSIAKIQRTFSFDSTTIKDAFDEIAEEIGCLFIYDSNSGINGELQRTISVYDLESYCLDCGYRGEFTGKCPECGSENITEGYGEDTTICISTENIADRITLDVDTDSVKNCFKLVTGDDLMTATVMNCNPNGSDYIWMITDDMKMDMSDELVQKLEAYDDLYNYYISEYTATISADKLSQYNALVNKYKVYNDELETIASPIVGFSKLMEAYYNTIDLNLYLDSVLMPDASMDDTSAEDEAALLTTANVSPVAVTNISYISQATADSAVLSAARVIVDARYQVKVNSSSLTGTTWTGNFSVTNYSDEEDTAVSATISVIINDDYETFVKQKIDKALKNENDDSVTDIVSLFELDLSQFQAELKKHCLTNLQSFQDACQSCIDIMIEQGVSSSQADPNLYDQLYLPYYNKLQAIQSEIKLRESEINLVIGEGGLQDDVIEIRNSIQKELNFENYLGVDLWKELCTFRREDTYENSNYISDGLDNAKIFSNAQDFLETAEKELYKSANLQHQIDADLKDLLVIKEFEPLVQYFSCGNWIRIKIDDEIFKLRILQYEIDYDNIERINVTFSDVLKIADGVSDVKDILDQAQSMGGSYNSVKHQAIQGSESSKVLADWVNAGMNLTTMKIVNSADNQNIVWDKNGFLCREYDEFSDTYSDMQLKIINKGVFLTDDNWKTSRTGIGNFIYYDPRDKTYKEGYGVIADTIVGNVILSSEVGIYNEDSSVQIDENGIVITTGEDYEGNTFTIRKEVNGGYQNQLYIDNNGNLNMSGIINASGGNIAGWNISSNSIWRGSNSLGAAGNGNAYFGSNGLSISNYFTVNSSGILTTNGATITNATITGLTASNATITNAQISSATVSGVLNATSGTFNNVDINTGSIGGWKVTATRISTSSSIYMGAKEAGMMLINEASAPFIAAQNANGDFTFKVDRDGSVLLNDASVTGNVIAKSLVAYEEISIYDTQSKGERVALRNFYGNQRILEVGGDFPSVNIGCNGGKVTIGAMNGDRFSVYTMDPNASIIEVFKVDADVTSAYLRSVPTYNRTYSGSPNLRITDQGTFGRSTSSSKRYKHNIHELSVSDIESLYDLPVVWFKYNNDYLAKESERYDTDIPGIIVEDLEDTLPITVDHLSDGSPEMWNNNIIVPCLLKLIQNNKKLIDELNAQIAQLKTNM